MHRSKSFGDEAVPAGNAIAAQALTRLGLLLGETRYLDAAARDAAFRLDPAAALSARACVPARSGWRSTSIRRK
jgi:uncharacterized protein YyaL (SSP411 family)